MGHTLLAGGNALAIASMRNDPTLTKLLLHLDNPLVTGEVWTEQTDNAAWKISDDENYPSASYGEWDAGNSEWDSQSDAFGPLIGLMPIGVWAAGLRPWKMRVTIRGGGAAEIEAIVAVYDGATRVAVGQASKTFDTEESTLEVPLDFTGKDYDIGAITFIVVPSAGPAFSVTKIEFSEGNSEPGSTDLRDNPPVDSSTQAHELTVHHPAGGPLLMNYDGTVKKFGNASVYKAAAETVYISAADSADWALGSGAWTIDFWVYLASLPDEGRGFGVCGQWEASNKYWALRFLNDGGLYIALSYAFYPGTSATTKLRLIDNFTVGKWNHVAMVRGADAPAGNYDLRYLSFFCNGRLADVRYLVGTGFEVPDLAAPLTVGLVKVGSDSAECFLGRLDELRIVKGGAMWLKDFVPPLGPYR